MQRAQEATGPSRPTQTITTHIPESDISARGTLRLRGQHSDSRRVAWTQNTIDNEKLGRKSSKICCIYHKPKNFDESSSESSSSSDSDDTGDEHDAGTAKDTKRKIQARREARKAKKSEDEDSCCEHNHGAVEQTLDRSDPVNNHGAAEHVVRHNAYEKVVK